MQDNLTRADLLSDVGSFTDEQRKARETFIDQELVLPREWLREAGGVSTRVHPAVSPQAFTTP
jgi:hypothetical protein